MLAWAVAVFGPAAAEPEERMTRFLEEAIELAHAEGIPATGLQRIIDRVYARPAGSVMREVGQAQLTLELYAETVGISAEAEAAREFERVRAIPKEQWAARHREKIDAGIAQ
jgi:hypothetical protein